MLYDSRTTHHVPHYVVACGAAHDRNQVLSVLIRLAALPGSMHQTLCTVDPKTDKIGNVGISRKRVHSDHLQNHIVGDDAKVTKSDNPISRSLCPASVPIGLAVNHFVWRSSALDDDRGLLSGLLAVLVAVRFNASSCECPSQISRAGRIMVFNAYQGRPCRIDQIRHLRRRRTGQIF